MITYTHAFSGFSVANLAKAKSFYENILGLQIVDTGVGLQLTIPSGHSIFIYAKPDHQPATFTILNLEVADIDEAVDELIRKGVKFEIYDGAHQDEKGIARGKAVDRGPDIAWFKDPAGNVLSILTN